MLRVQQQLSLGTSASLGFAICATQHVLGKPQRSTQPPGEATGVSQERGPEESVPAWLLGSYSSTSGLTATIPAGLNPNQSGRYLLLRYDPGHLWPVGSRGLYLVLILWRDEERIRNVILEGRNRISLECLFLSGRMLNLTSLGDRRTCRRA